MFGKVDRHAEPGRHIPGRKVKTMYMSYCRFEGTHQEMKACLADVEEHLAEMAKYEVSEDEVDHFRDMVMDFFGWMQDNELITEDGELDDDQLDGICQAMRKAYTEE